MVGAACTAIDRHQSHVYPTLITPTMKVSTVFRHQMPTYRLKLLQQLQTTVRGPRHVVLSFVHLFLCSKSTAVLTEGHLWQVLEEAQLGLTTFRTNKKDKYVVSDSQCSRINASTTEKYSILLRHVQHILAFAITS
jgi:hypothetical protein